MILELKFLSSPQSHSSQIWTVSDNGSFGFYTSTLTPSLDDEVCFHIPFRCLVRIVSSYVAVLL